MVVIDQNKVLQYINANDNLSNIFNYYLNNCITLTNPYHNINHTLAMMYHICNIYEESQDENYEFHLDSQSLYILLVSAIFHDFNHSAGMFIDAVNVDNAVRIMENYFNNEFSNDRETAESVKEIVHDNIWATCCYPYVIVDSELNLYQRILRECDILVCFSTDFLSQLFVGLKTELRINDWKEFIAKEVKFLLDSWKNLKLYYSKQLVKENEKDFLSCTETLINIIK